MNLDLFCSGGCWCSWTSRPPRKKRGKGRTGAGKADVFVCSLSRCDDLFFRLANFFPGRSWTFWCPRDPRERGASGSQGTCHVTLISKKPNGVDMKGATACLSQGDRGFDGLAGPRGAQGEKGERVSL